MNSPTHKAFLDDSYLTACECKIVERLPGGVVLDVTNFYATSGGQPGDTGLLEFQDGSKLTITGTVYDSDRKRIIHHFETDTVLPPAGETVVAHLDWERRYALMKMHTACHLLSVVCPYPITGANVSLDDSRVDFQIDDPTFTKVATTDAVMELVNADHPIFTQWISEAQLDDDPSIIRSKNVKPPRGLGDIRLVCIGENSCVDSQPCGGTHVSQTNEIGEIHIGKIEKKGRENRRFRIRFGVLEER